jgi:hypothetical protein
MANDMHPLMYGFEPRTPNEPSWHAAELQPDRSDDWQQLAAGLGSITPIHQHHEN